MFGISGSALNWFQSYLENRSYTVIIEGSESVPKYPTCGIPQGSVLVPLLFTMYMKPQGSIIEQHWFYYHCYADNVQCYVSFNNKSCESLLRFNDCLYSKLH